MSRAVVPLPSTIDLENALEHFYSVANSEEFGMHTPDEFDLRYLGMLSVKQLKKYDDVSSWLETDPDEYKGQGLFDKLEGLRDFRGDEWAEMAAQWLIKGIPPIVIVTAPDENGMLYTVIGDGRGRVNFAHLMEKKVPAYEMIYKGDGS